MLDVSETEILISNPELLVSQLKSLVLHAEYGSYSRLISDSECSHHSQNSIHVLVCIVHRFKRIYGKHLAIFSPAFEPQRLMWTIIPYNGIPPGTQPDVVISLHVVAPSTSYKLSVRQEKLPY